MGASLISGKGRTVMYVYTAIACSLIVATGNVVVNIAEVVGSNSVVAREGNVRKETSIR